MLGTIICHSRHSKRGAHVLKRLFLVQAILMAALFPPVTQRPAEQVAPGLDEHSFVPVQLSSCHE